MMRFPAPMDLAPLRRGLPALADATIILLSRVGPILGLALPAFTKKSSGEKAENRSGNRPDCCVLRYALTCGKHGITYQI
jgi:hypothetical protein